jgi:hypothetical protein
VSTSRCGLARWGWSIPGTKNRPPGICTFCHVQPHQYFLGLWTGAWLTCWLFAFRAVMVAAPLARKAAPRLTTWD